MSRLRPLWHTATVLGISASVNSGAAYLGCMDSQRILGSVFADQAGANPSLVLNFSTDATDNDIPAVNIGTPLAANTATLINVEVRAPYVKVTFTNGATGQGTFRLYLYLADWSSNLTVT